MMKPLFTALARKFPHSIQEIIFQNGFKKYFENTTWMFLAHIVTFITSFLTIAIVARYLGPENFGKLSYTQSFVALFSIFASLGIDQIIYRDLITYPEKQNKLLGTAVIAKLVAGTITFFVTISTSLILESDHLLTFLVAISAFTFILNPIGILSIFFNAKVQAKYNSHITIFSALFIPLVKLLLIYFDRGIIFFAATLVLESLISVVYLIYIYTKKYRENPLEWKFSLPILKTILRDSWPLMLAGISAQIYSKIDQVMIQHLIDSTSVGLYSVATRLTQIAQTFPGIIIAALLPALLNARRHDRDIYLKRFKSLTKFIVILSICIILPIFFFAPFIVEIIFGKAFQEATPVLRIHIWSTIGIMLVTLTQHYLIAENLGKIYFITTMIGAGANIILNIILIPTMGIAGAAVATLSSYILILFNLLLFKRIRLGARKIIHL